MDEEFEGGLIATDVVFERDDFAIQVDIYESGYLNWRVLERFKDGWEEVSCGDDFEPALDDYEGDPPRGAKSAATKWERAFEKNGVDHYREMEA